MVSKRIQTNKKSHTFQDLRTLNVLFHLLLDTCHSSRILLVLGSHFKPGESLVCQTLLPLDETKIFPQLKQTMREMEVMRHKHARVSYPCQSSKSDIIQQQRKHSLHVFGKSLLEPILVVCLDRFLHESYGFLHVLIGHLQQKRCQKTLFLFPPP